MVTPPSRADYYRVLADTLPDDTLVVTALGNASYLWAVLRDRPENFYVEDAMGLALPLAVGLAAARADRQVVVVQGDGGLLMHMGALVTAGAVACANLTILLIENGVHAASGGQPLTHPAVDYAALAGAAGIESANIDDTESFATAVQAALARPATSFLSLRTEPDMDIVVPAEPFDPVLVKRRFEKAVGARRYVPEMFGGGSDTGG